MTSSMAQQYENYVAKRYPGKPLEQPSYRMRDIPFCEKDLKGSTIEEIEGRDIVNNAMAEMILLTTETTRRKFEREEEKLANEGTQRKWKKEQRNRKGGRETKPLSLEYMADRLDVDDPLFGYVVRTNESQNNVVSNKLGIAATVPINNLVEGGMLQGFITFTTFTNWQKTFRWDSMHDSTFSYDDSKTVKEMRNGTKEYDRDGSLASQLQDTIRCGDPWLEGILFPHIAEISLFGGLGCGRVLLSLALEKLECMRPSNTQNYDFVVLQATANSVSFYQSMGFVRVGAITENPKPIQNETVKVIEGENESKGELKNPKNAVRAPEIFSTPTTIFVIQRDGQTPLHVARILKIDVWDIIFFNHLIHPTINPKSWLYKATELICPDSTKFDGISNALHNETSIIKSSAIQWYHAKNNETPRDIAIKFGVQCKDLVSSNRKRITDLRANSRLRKDTKIQVSQFSSHHDRYVPYCHWTFPDDKFEDNEPSYMMAKKLNRKNIRQARIKPVQSKYMSRFKAVRKCSPEIVTPDSEVETTKPLNSIMKEKDGKSSNNFFNQVVKLKKNSSLDADNKFKYYFVLTYIPDLFWCHLIPMKKAGVWSVKNDGRIKWMLVCEHEGYGLDISASACEIVKSKAMRGCPDADEEEWDIVEGEQFVPTNVVRTDDLSQNVTKLNDNLTHKSNIVAAVFEKSTNPPVINAKAFKKSKADTPIFKVKNEPMKNNAEDLKKFFSTKEKKITLNRGKQNNANKRIKLSEHTLVSSTLLGSFQKTKQYSHGRNENEREILPVIRIPVATSNGSSNDQGQKVGFCTVGIPYGKQLDITPYKQNEHIKNINEKKQSERKKILVEGNLSYCCICRTGGCLICCHICPRSFHDRCLGVESEKLPDRWECHKCEHDASIQRHDHVVGTSSFMVMSCSFKYFENLDDFRRNIVVLSKIHEMIKILLHFDFGYYFANPLNVNFLNNCRRIVEYPFDLETIDKNMTNGYYSKKIIDLKKSCNVGKCSTMDLAILEILKDIEYVWHNCMVWNREGSCAHRMATVMRSKSYKIRRCSFDNDLSPFVKQWLGTFIGECKTKRSSSQENHDSFINHQINSPFPHEYKKAAEI